MSNRLPYITMAVAAAALLAAAADMGYILQLTAAAPAWQWWTAHLTHWSADHLLWDVVALLGLGFAAERLSRGATALTLFTAAPVIALAVLAMEAPPLPYRGLSGLDSALFGLLAATALFKPGKLRLLAGAAMGLFFAKSGYEFATGATLFVDQQAGDFTPVPAAHLVGAAVGALIAIAHACFTQTSPTQSRRPSHVATRIPQSA